MFRRAILQSRAFATESTAGKLVVNFAVPHKAIVQSKVMTQVRKGNNAHYGTSGGHHFLFNP